MQDPDNREPNGSSVHPEILVVMFSKKRAVSHQMFFPGNSEYDG